MNRRQFIQASTAAAGGAALGGAALSGTLPRTAAAQARADAAPLPASIAALKRLPGTVTPISDDERRSRIERARRLMTDNGLSAVFIEPGSSMVYFAGTRWGLSERPFGLVIPARGELAWVAP